MIETTVIRGKWFLTSDTTKKVHGTLTCDPLKGIQLEIEEPLEGNEETFELELSKADIILGESRDGVPITLYSCFRTGSSWGGSYSATWYVNKAFVGCHELDPSAIYFTEIVLRVRPLFLWLDSSGIRINNSQTPGLSVTFSYTKPDDIDIPIDEKVFGKIRFHSSYSIPSTYSESIKLTHWASISIQTIGDDLTHIELWEYIQRFLNWLTVTTGYPHDIEKVSYFHENLIDRILSDGTKIRQEVILYSKKQRVIKKPERPDQLLFTYPDLKKCMPDVLTHWFSLYQSIEAVIQILSENMGRDIAFSEFHFKDIIQALEAFHRKRVRNEKMPSEDYEAYKNQVICQLNSEEDRSFVEGRLKYGNEPTLKERLGELIERQRNIPSLQSIIGKKKTFIWQVTENRNYLTHLDESGKSGILHSIDLYHLSERALALLFVTVISEVIPEGSIIDNALKTSSRFRNYIK
ncbi:HEPN domain-containing protein [Spirosoma sp. KNUC1025]|uniref:ApeA N-terminal domain 1-containing protein n=1 Tax=Spirosoma sp. KNUC1025 TaxID=2894082 RepID=UPI00386A4AC2|nr:hypothetical protein LN737_04460 [Spirosoma sp. KNUC1025]